MELGFVGIIVLFIIVVSIIMLLVALFSPNNSITALWRRNTRLTSVVDPAVAAQAAEFVQNTTPQVQRPILQPSSVPIFSFDREQEVVKVEDELGEVDGDLIDESATDSRFTLKSLYPGAVRGELILTTPTRRTVRLCEKGGFLRRYGRAEWRWIPSIRLSGYDVFYDKSGRFKMGDLYLKAVTLRYKGELYPLEIVSATS